MNSKPIVFTGGHHNSALLVAKRLKSRGNKIIWLGHKYTMKGDCNISQEYKDVTGEGIEFIELKSGKIHKSEIFCRV
jgi:UDP-N-acetylglucosamine:LPS N-acetylglucosamine transferase